MTSPAKSKSWTVGLASLIAAGILGATLYFGGGGSLGKQTSSVVIIDPNELPGAGDGIRGQELEIRRQDKGRELYFKADSTEPIEGGNTFVEKPLVRVFFEGRKQHLELRADRGSIYMPSDNPKSGRLMGNVWLTFFEPPEPGAYPDWDDLSQVAMHLRLDDADFDLERGEIYSRSPLDLYTPTTEFHGVGLRLVFNQLRNRLEHLRIDKGDFLRVYQASGGDDGGDDTGAEITPREPVVASGTTTIVEEAGNGPRLTKAEDPTASQTDALALEQAPSVNPPRRERRGEAEPDQYYEATFEDDIRIDTVHNAYALRGDRLTLLFGVEGDGAEQRSGSKRAADPLGGLGLAQPYRPASESDGPHPVVLTSTDSARFSALSARDLTSITAKGPQDVVMKWSGPMVIRPNPNKPTELKHTNDLFVRLSGDIATLRTDEGTRVSGVALSYTREGEGIVVERSESVPVRVQSPEQGTMVGGDLRFDGSRGRGRMTGPVTLIASQDLVLDTEAPSESDPLASEPPAGDAGFRATAAEAMAFVLLPKAGEPDPEEQADGPKLFGGQALKKVDLIGAVRVEDPRMTAEAESLTLAFKPTRSDESALSRVTAQGDVAVMVTDPEGDQPLWISSDRLVLDLSENRSGQTGLNRLTATGSVAVSAPELLLDTEHLDADFLEDSAGKTQLGVTHALGGVRAVIQTGESDTQAQTAWVEGERLSLDPSAEKMTALGAIDAPARLAHKGSELIGPAVRLDGLARMASVWGPGVGRVPMDVDAAERAANAQDIFTARWQRGLAVSEQQGYAAVMGTAQGERVNRQAVATETSEMAGDLIRLDLEPDPDRGPMWSAVDAVEKQARAQQPLGGGVQRVIAIGQAKVFGQQTPGAPGPGSVALDADPKQEVQPSSRIWIEGPRIEADILAETLTVPAAGFMLIEDYEDAWAQQQADPQAARAQAGTSASEAAQASGAAASPVLAEASSAETQASGPDDSVADSSGVGAEGGDQGAKLTGKGATSLTWQDRMVLEARTNDAVLEGRVTMTHAPLLPNGELDYANKARLYCQVLKIDVIETGGLASWASGEAAQPEIRGIACDRSVQLRYGPQRVYADHMRYTASDQEVWFGADAGQRVRFEDTLRGTGIANRWVKWSLPTNTFTGEPAGPVIVPIFDE